MCFLTMNPPNLPNSTIATSIDFRLNVTLAYNPLCKHITAVSTRRLRLDKEDIKRNDISKISEINLREIERKILNDFSEKVWENRV